MTTEPRIIGDTHPGTETPGGPAGGENTAGPPPVEIGGRGGPDPTRYGDWEKNGRCIDF